MSRIEISYKIKPNFICLCSCAFIIVVMSVERKDDREKEITNNVRWERRTSKITQIILSPLSCWSHFYKSGWVHHYKRPLCLDKLQLYQRIPIWNFLGIFHAVSAVRKSESEFENSSGMKGWKQPFTCSLERRR